MVFLFLYNMYSYRVYLKLMTIQINYKNKGSIKTSSNLVLFVDEKFNIGSLKKFISNNEFSYISDLLKNSDLKKELLYFDINSNKTIFLVSKFNNIIEIPIYFKNRTSGKSKIPKIEIIRTLINLFRLRIF